MEMFYKIQCSNVQLIQLQTRLSCRGSVELNKYTFLSSFASCSLNYQKNLQVNFNLLANNDKPRALFRPQVV